MPETNEPNPNPSSKGGIFTYILIVALAAVYLLRQHIEAESKKVKEGKGSERYNQIPMLTNANKGQGTNFFNRFSQ